jgi:hypothetical protein
MSMGTSRRGDGCAMRDVVDATLGAGSRTLRSNRRARNETKCAGHANDTLLFCAGALDLACLSAVRAFAEFAVATARLDLQERRKATAFSRPLR